MTKTINVSQDLLFTMVLRTLRTMGPLTIKGLAKEYGLDGDAWETKNALMDVLGVHRDKGGVYKDGQRYAATDLDALHADALDERMRAECEEIERAPLSVIATFINSARVRFDRNDEAWEVYGTLHAYEQERNELANRVRDLKHMAEHVEERLKADVLNPGVNSLGEVQQAGTRVDVSCGRLDIRVGQLKAAITWNASDDYRRRLLEHVRAALKKPETHAAFNARGEEVKVTIPE